MSIEPGAFPQVATIVPCLGNVRKTRACLKALFEEGYPKNAVIVVENGTTENVAALKPEFPQAHFLALKKNEGFAGGSNAGVREARARFDPDFYFFLNNDAEVEKGAVGSLARLMQDRRDCGIAAPKILTGRGEKTIWAAGGTFIPWRFMAKNRGQGEKDRGQFDRQEELDFLSGCAIMLRKAVIENEDAFDEVFFTYAEDLDLSLRSRKAGWKLLYHPSSVVYHEGGATSGTQYQPFQSFYRWRNRLLIARKHGGPAQKLVFYGLFFPALIQRDMGAYIVKRKWESIGYLWAGLGQFFLIALLGTRPEPMRAVPDPRKSLKSGYLLSNPAALLVLQIVDALGALASAFKKMKTPPRNPDKILIAKIDHLGDVLMCLRVLPSIKNRFPQSKIHMVCASWSKAIVENHPLVDKVLTFDDFRLNRKGRIGARIARTAKDSLALIRAMRREKYAAALDFRAYYPNLLPVLALGGPGFLSGYGTGGFGFLTDASPEWREGIHETEHFFDLLQIAWPSLKRVEADFGYLADSRAAGELIKKHSSGTEEPIAVFHAFCRKSFLSDQKEWKMEKWKEVLRWAEKNGTRVFCTGDADDAPFIDRMIQGGRAVNAAGATPLPALAGLIRASDFVLTLDTFTAHLSGALGARTIVLFNDVEPVEQWKPWGESVRVLPIESTADDVVRLALAGWERQLEPRFLLQNANPQ